MNTFTVGRIRETEKGYMVDIEPVDTLLSLFIPSLSELTVLNITSKWEQFLNTNNILPMDLKFSESVLEYIKKEKEYSKLCYGFSPVIAHAKVIGHAEVK